TGSVLVAAVGGVAPDAVGEGPRLPCEDVVRAIGRRQRLVTGEGAPRAPALGIEHVRGRSAHRDAHQDTEELVHLAPPLQGFAASMPTTPHGGSVASSTRRYPEA